MLREIERKLTAVVADGLTTRTHLQVLAAPGPVSALDPGQGAVLVAMAEVGLKPVFERSQLQFTGPPDGPQSRRVLPVDFLVRLRFSLRPATQTPPGLDAARTLLLEDMSLTAHLLGDEAVQNGKVFATAPPDHGFQVLSFALDQGIIAPDLANNFLTGELAYQGQAYIWPPGLTQAEGTILAIDQLMTALPLRILVDDLSLPLGGTTTVRVRGMDERRLVDPKTGTRQPLKLAVAVVSDLPPAQRGAITGGDPGQETGFHLIAATAPETLIGYKAPAGDVGATRVEYIAVHLATPDGHRGVFLGSAAVRLSAGGH